MINHNIDLMKQKELSSRMDFLDKNPVVLLPVNLDSELVINEHQDDSSNNLEVTKAPFKENKTNDIS